MIRAIYKYVFTLAVIMLFSAATASAAEKKTWTERFTSAIQRFIGKGSGKAKPAAAAVKDAGAKAVEQGKKEAPKIKEEVKENYPKVRDTAKKEVKKAKAEVKSLFGLKKKL